MAYFLIHKVTDRTIIAVDTTKVAEVLNIHRHTVVNRFKKAAGKAIETDKYIVIQADIFYEHLKSSGNTDSKEDKLKKANGDIECKYPRKNRRWRR